jgi:hypothetical protein
VAAPLWRVGEGDRRSGLPAAALGWRAGGWQVAVPVFMMGLLAAAGLRLLERRYQEQAEDVDREALARRVLYLRPFGLDQRMGPVCPLRGDELGREHRLGHLESFLADDMERSIGPLVALCSPRDVLPRVAGRGCTRPTAWGRRSSGDSSSRCRRSSWCPATPRPRGAYRPQVRGLGVDGRHCCPLLLLNERGQGLCV